MKGVTMNLYTVVFEDNTTWAGGDYLSPKWREVPDKNIRSIFYLLPLGDALVLSGYEAYQIFMEIAPDFYGGDGKVQLEYAYIIGKKGNQAKQYKINLKTQQIEIKILSEDDIKKINPIRWKQGV
jgi:hypothetical protein